MLSVISTFYLLLGHSDLLCTHQKSYGSNPNHYNALTHWVTVASHLQFIQSSPSYLSQHRVI